MAAVSYLNTKPLLYGFEQGIGKEAVELVLDYPARIAQMLIDGEVDVGLIPVAATLQLPEWHLNGDYCIGAVGPVASVCLFSEVPVEAIEEVYLDYQSRTSVRLCRLLLQEYWKKDVKFLQATGEQYRDHIKGKTAGLVIGDRALEQRLRSLYSYDLAEAWKAHTGLPFVFAGWISSRPLVPDQVALLNEINAYGLHRIDEVVAAHPYAAFSLHEYFTRCISYRLDAPKRAGLRLFLDKIRAQQL